MSKITQDRKLEETIDVVTCFLSRNDTVLLLQRSQKVGSYRGDWAGVSGFLETVAPLRQAHIELEEEVGLTGDDVRLECAGEPLLVADEATGRRYRVHPFRFSIHEETVIRLDWEHTSCRWVHPEQMRTMKTVPGLYDAWSRVSEISTEDNE